MVGEGRPRVARRARRWSRRERRRASRCAPTASSGVAAVNRPAVGWIVTARTAPTATGARRVSAPGGRGGGSRGGGSGTGPGSGPGGVQAGGDRCTGTVGPTTPFWLLPFVVDNKGAQPERGGWRGGTSWRSTAPIPMHGVEGERESWPGRPPRPASWRRSVVSGQRRAVPPVVSTRAWADATEGWSRRRSQADAAPDEDGPLDPYPCRDERSGDHAPVRRPAAGVLSRRRPPIPRNRPQSASGVDASMTSPSTTSSPPGAAPGQAWARSRAVPPASGPKRTSTSGPPAGVRQPDGDRRTRRGGRVGSGALPAGRGRAGVGQGPSIRIRQPCR